MATLPLSPNFTNLNSQLNSQLASSIETSDAVNNLPSSYVNNNIDTLSNTSLKSDSIIDYTLRKNPLHQYSSFNYTISLEATDNIGVNNWNNASNYKSKYVKTDWIPIIRSGGIVTGAKNRFDPEGDSVQRQYFKSDLYIDNLEIETLVATSASARSSTDCSVSFTITEPYGMSFLSDLWEFNSNVIQSESYLETAYLLKIGFKGFDDDGKFIDLQEYVKYIPIKFVNVDLKFTNAGAIYTVTAIPYNDQGNNEIYGRVRTSGKLIGKTVGEMLRGYTYITKGQIESANPSDKKTLLDEFEFYQSDFSLATILTENAAATIKKNERNSEAATYDEYVIKFTGNTRLDTSFPGRRSDKEIQKATAINTAPQRIEVPSPIIGLISERMEMCRIAQNKIAGTNMALRTMVPPESMISRPEMASACKNKGTRLKRNDCNAMILIIPTMRWFARMVSARNTAKMQLTSIQDIIPLGPPQSDDKTKESQRERNQ